MKWILLLTLLVASQVGGLACYCIGTPPTPTTAAPFQLVIADPDETPPETVAALKSMGKTVLAYINVGYAEDWRWYWPRALGDGIVHEATEYGGEYFVEYWSEEWAMIIEEYVSAVLESGFDGVYLDNVDVALILSESRPPWAQGVDLNESMIALIERVERLAGTVYINIGAAVYLLYNDTLLQHVDGVLREEAMKLLEGPGRYVPIPTEESRDVLEALAYARDHGVRVLVVEFVASWLDATLYYLLYTSMGFTPILQPDTDPDYKTPPLVPPLAGGVQCPAGRHSPG